MGNYLRITQPKSATCFSIYQTFSKWEKWNSLLFSWRFFLEAYCAIWLLVNKQVGGLCKMSRLTKKDIFIHIDLLKHVYTSSFYIFDSESTFRKPGLKTMSSGRFTQRYQTDMDYDIILPCNTLIINESWLSTLHIKSRICEAYILILCNLWMRKLGFGRFYAFERLVHGKIYCARMV